VSRRRPDKADLVIGAGFVLQGRRLVAPQSAGIGRRGRSNNASYAIRNLISAKKLTIESTIKNALTGKLETQVNVVHGPTAVFVTTTNPQTDAETRSRFIVTSVDESSEQTRVILEAQRHSHTLEGMLKKHRRSEVLTRHHALQRSLRPLKVVNPFEPLLAYAEDRLVMRRENPKYLHLILCVTFLYQMQRTVKEHPELGEYIETRSMTSRWPTK
jgi:hypothetical protein